MKLVLSIPSFSPSNSLPAPNLVRNLPSTSTGKSTWMSHFHVTELSNGRAGTGAACRHGAQVARWQTAHSNPAQHRLSLKCFQRFSTFSRPTNAMSSHILSLFDLIFCRTWSSVFLQSFFFFSIALPLIDSTLKIFIHNQLQCY